MSFELHGSVPEIGTVCMVTNEAEVKAAAQHIWQHAKRIVLSGNSGDTSVWRVAGFDVQDRQIDEVSAESLEALKKKLDSMIPDGGQAP
jgi:hypothetical protein